MAEHDKTALVTGASGGVGSETARRLHELGWRVFAGVRSREAGEKLADGRDGVIPIELDLLDETSVASARDEIGRLLDGRGLYGLVNNAGLSVDGPLELVPLSALRRQLEVNVIGHVAVIQAFLPLLRLCRGRIVNIGGAAGRLCLPMYGALSASKAALDSLSDALRVELKHQHVHVSYIEPGALQTAFFAKSAEAARRDGYAGDAATQAIYAKAIEASAKALAKSSSGPVDAAVDAIVKALSARRPAARYVVGRQTRLALRTLPRLPAAARDRVLMSILELRAEAFDSAHTVPKRT